MFTLRQAIFDRLKDISEERRALADERRQLLDRLQTLEQQTSGIDAASVIGTMNQTVQALSELVPHVPASVVIQEVAKKMESNGTTIDISNQEERQAAATQAEVHEAATVSKLATKPTEKPHYSARDVGRIIVAYLRENGGVASNKDIEKFLLDEHGVQYKDMSQALWSIRQVTPQLKKGKQGFSMIMEAVSNQ